MQKVIVLSGVSGIGKSTYAEQLVRLQKWAYQIVSADDFYVKNGVYTYEADKIGEAHAWCFRQFMEAIGGGGQISRTPLVIVDNTNLTQREISPYMLAAAAFGYEAEIVTLRSKDPSIAGPRNQHGLPPSEQEAQLRRLETRHLVPWWKNTDVLVD